MLPDVLRFACCLSPTVRQDTAALADGQQAAGLPPTRVQDAAAASAQPSFSAAPLIPLETEAREGDNAQGRSTGVAQTQSVRSVGKPPAFSFGHADQHLQIHHSPTNQSAPSVAPQPSMQEIDMEEASACDVRRSPSSCSGSADSSVSMCMDMMTRSPYFMTAISLDSRKIYQSPRSISYYGDLRAQAAAGGEAVRAGLAMSVLQRLFGREGESMLEEMLDAVLDGEGPDSCDEHSWCKVIRVPCSCYQEAAHVTRTLSTKHVNVTFAPHTVASQHTDSFAGTTQAQALGPVVSEEQEVWYRNGLAGPNSKALIQVTQVEDNAACDRWSAAVPAQSSTPPALANASDISFGIRNAPQRVKSLLDLNLANKSGSSGPGSHGMLKGPSFSRGSLMLVEEDSDKGLPISSRTLPLPSTHLGESSRRRRGRSEALYHVDPAGASALPEDKPAAQLSSPSSKSRLLSILNTRAMESNHGNAAIEHNSRALAGLLEEPDSSRTQMTTWGSQGLAPVPNIVPLGTHQASELMGGIASRDHILDSQPDDSREPAEPPCWHEVFVTRTKNETGRELLMIYQTDVTMRTQLETTMAQLTELQLNTLCQIFPRHVIEFLSTGGNMSLPANLGHLARSHADVSILFMDIVGFTSMSKQVAPDTVMTFLNSLFSLFDDLCESHRCHKVETAGDCYIVSSGLLSVDAEGFAQVAQDHDPAESTANLFDFAKDMLAASREVLMPHDGTPVQVRIGIHTGPCVSGVVGSKLPKFGIFGDTMNTASRMESTCTPGRIQVSSATHSLLMLSGRSSAHEWHATGGIKVKGKGVMETYMWREPTMLAVSAPVPSTPTDLDELLSRMTRDSASVARRISAPMGESARQARGVGVLLSRQQALDSGVALRQQAVLPLPLGVQTAAGADTSHSLPSLSDTTPHLPASLRSHLLRGHKSQGNQVSAFNAMTQTIFQLARESKDGAARRMLMNSSSYGSALDTSNSMVDTLHSNGRRLLHRTYSRSTRN